MPQDKYRNQGPESSEDYHLYAVQDECSQSRQHVDKNGARSDGRGPDEQRKIYLKTGVVNSIKGSCYAEVGKTKVLVSVYEPREIPRLAEFCPNGELNVEFRFAPFSSKTRRPPLMQSDEKDLSLMVKRALEPAVCRSEFPNCQVDVYVMVLDNDGSCFAAGVTAAAVAIADAGIPMFDTVGAVTLGIQGDHTFLDPTQQEEEFCCSSSGKTVQPHGLISIAYLSSIGQLSATSVVGCVDARQITDCLDSLILHCGDVAELARLRLSKDVLKKCKEEEDVENNEVSS